MSYLRGEWYIWRAQGDTHLWSQAPQRDETERAQDSGFGGGVAVPDAVLDAFALMRTAELTADKTPAQVRALQREVLAAHGGNFGSAALHRLVGQTPPWMEGPPGTVRGDD
jgi:hypothetical protein